MDRRALKFAILEIMARPGIRSECKRNLSGHATGPGQIEVKLGTQFDSLVRFEAGRAFDELVAAGLLVPTYKDLLSPEEWVEITAAGRAALSRRALDALDRALAQISPHLTTLRDGAWAAVAAHGPDAARQAAHSARELIDQTLKIGAPDDLVRASPGFVPDPKSKGRVTRKQRLRFMMHKSGGEKSESALRMADNAASLVMSACDRLLGLAHSRSDLAIQTARDAIGAAEIALRTALVAEA